MTTKKEFEMYQARNSPIVYPVGRLFYLPHLTFCKYSNKETICLGGPVYHITTKSQQMQPQMLLAIEHSVYPENYSQIKKVS